MVEVLFCGGICERVFIDEVYLDIMEVVVVRLIKGFFFFGIFLEEVWKIYILGFEEVSIKLCLYLYIVMGWVDGC